MGSGIKKPVGQVLVSATGRFILELPYTTSPEPLTMESSKIVDLCNTFLRTLIWRSPARIDLFLGQGLSAFYERQMACSQIGWGLMLPYVAAGHWIPAFVSCR